jgi:hypothetical protein
MSFQLRAVALVLWVVVSWGLSGCDAQAPSNGTVGRELRRSLGGEPGTLDGCDGDQDLPVAPVSHLIWAIGVAGVAVPAYHAALRGVVRSVERPVPLEFSYSETPLSETLESFVVDLH